MFLKLKILPENVTSKKLLFLHKKIQNKENNFESMFCNKMKNVYLKCHAISTLISQ